jgi:hypothetical protein
VNTEKVDVSRKIIKDIKDQGIIRSVGSLTDPVLLALDLQDADLPAEIEAYIETVKASQTSHKPVTKQ